MKVPDEGGGNVGVPVLSWSISYNSLDHRASPVDGAPQEENTSSSTPFYPYYNALDNMSSDEETMDILEEVLVTERTAASDDTLQTR